MKASAILAALAAFALVALPIAATANPQGCPPGLAKKNPPCIPPGQAKKGVTQGEWDFRDHMGEVIDRDSVIYLDDYPLYQLPPPPPGSRYAVVDGNIVVIDNESYRILQWIRVFNALTE